MMTRYTFDPDDPLASATRAELLAWLMAERGALLAQLTGLDERILCERPILAGWTVKDLLAHVAYWDAFFTESVTLALAGRATEVLDVNLDARNAEVYAARRDWSLAATLDVFSNARADFLVVFSQAPLETLDEEYTFGWGQASLRRCAAWRGYHDRTHTAQIAAWRQSA